MVIPPPLSSTKGETHKYLHLFCMSLSKLQQYSEEAFPTSRNSLLKYWQILFCLSQEMAIKSKRNEHFRNSVRIIPFERMD